MFVINEHVGDPEKYRKQADVVQVAAKNLEDEAGRLVHTHDQVERDLNMQTKKKKVNIDHHPPICFLFRFLFHFHLDWLVDLH